MDDKVYSVVAVLELVRTATIDDVRALKPGLDDTKAEQQLMELRITPLAFLAQLDDIGRAKFVFYARQRFERAQEQVSDAKLSEPVPEHAD